MALRLFTSESVTEGHPDKICDAISDSILDALLERDPEARVAVETVVTTGLVHVVGEIRTSTYVEIPQIVRNKLLEIGFTSSEMGFDGHTCGVSVSVGEQSQEIARGVDTAIEHRNGEPTSLEEEDKLGAGDQGLMFGYATNETPEFMPLPISLPPLGAPADRGAQGKHHPWLATRWQDPGDFEYDDAGKPVSIETIVISTQHDPSWEGEAQQASFVPASRLTLLITASAKQVWGTSFPKISTC